MQRDLPVAIRYSHFLREISIKALSLSLCSNFLALSMIVMVLVSTTTTLNKYHQRMQLPDSNFLAKCDQKLFPLDFR